MRTGEWRPLLASICILGAGLAADDPAPKDRGPTLPGLKRDGAVLLPNGWSLKPAGRQSPLGDLPVIIAENPAHPVLAILHAGYGEHEIWTLDAKTGRTIARAALPATFSGLAWSPDGARLYAGGGFDDVVCAFDHKDGMLSNRALFEYPEPEDAEGHRGRREGAPQRVPAGLAVSKDGLTLYVANAFGHSLATFDTKTGKMTAERPLGKDTYPFAVCLDEAKGRVYASLWGAAKVAILDTAKDLAVIGHYETQEHPNEMLTAKGGKFLFVANANRNTVTVIDTEAGKAVETINTAIDPKAPSGSTPSSLSLSPDESVLFVANANTNDVAAFMVKEPGESTPLGFIPVGWYPTSVRASRDGKTLWVANGKGGTSKANRDGPMPGMPGGGGNRVRQYIAGLFTGTLSTIPMPTAKQMPGYSKTVYQCSPLRKGEPEAVNVGPEVAASNPIPRKLGDPSPITHCIYIIKENRTYDQVFGDMKEGNGEPSICLFPEDVTPNHHALAREFVLLDNFYVESEVSADGHEWTMGAYATDFVERTWPLSYRGDKRVPYPAEGNFQIATPAGGYLWDRAKAKGVTYRSYGEFVDNGKTPDDPATTTVEALKGHFDPKFRSYDLNYPDQKRADRFLEELAEFEAKGEMPRLIVLRLPNDHTAGTSPGKPTIKAMIADNDLALGRVVEGLSKSKFWPKLAIFVVEDDAQNGSDHVDAHRTVALAIGPYIKKKSVDSTMYSTSSMLRTMELILGLEPMSQFDAAARPMSNAFAAGADLAPYKVRPPKVDIRELNLRDAPNAEASRKLDLDKEDRADDIAFNRIIWQAVKGKDAAMPPPVRAAFIIPRAKAEGEKDDD